MPKLAYTILYVKDVAKAVAFYEKVFDLPVKFIAEGNAYAELITGSTTLSFASTALAKSNLPEGFTEANNADKPFAMEIGFTTDNVEQLYKKAIEAGAIAVAAPATKP